MATSAVPKRADDTDLTALAVRIRGEFVEMPGLRVTLLQAERLFSLRTEEAVEVFDELQAAAVLAYSNGLYSLR